MTPETEVNIREWFTVRDAYLKRAGGRTKWKSHFGTPKEEWKGKPRKDERLFPFEHTTAYVIWKNAVNKAGLSEKDEITGRDRLHPHVLRKWCRTRLGTVLSQDVVEALIGHEGYMTREYRRFATKELSEFYLEGQEVLFLEVDLSVDRLNGKIREQEKQLQAVTISQAARIAELEQQIKELAEKEDELYLKDSRIDELEQKIEQLARVLSDPISLRALYESREKKTE